MPFSIDTWLDAQTPRIRYWVKQPVTWIFISFLLILVLLLLFGIPGLLVGVLFMTAVMVFFWWQNRPSEQVQLETERQTLLDELQMVEKKLLHREISQDLFDSISREKQARLVELDSKLLTLQKGPLTPATSDDSRFSSLEVKRRHRLRTLLEEQAMAKQVLKLANQKLLKREIDMKTFEKISREKQEELLSIEAKITQLYREEATEVMKTAKDRLELNGEMVPDEEVVAEEIADQMMKKQK